jgi:hypothetical protein
MCHFAILKQNFADNDFCLPVVSEGHDGRAIVTLDKNCACSHAFYVLSE